MSDKILKIFGRYIYDSRGNPTVEVDLWTSKGIKKKESIIFFPFLCITQKSIFDKTRP
jgi:hypothetical protein